jgi:MFS family permease
VPELESGPLILPPYDCRSITGASRPACACRGLIPPLTQGALGYGLTSVMGAVVREIFQGKQYGSIFGTMMLAALAGGAAGPWATGLLYDLSGSYTIAFAIGIAVSLLSAVAIWQASPRKVRAVAGQMHKVKTSGGAD